MAALPIGYYFLQNPQDFLGRGGQVSIFSAESPLFEFAKSNLATLGMFFVPGRGDCNWRHNLNCKPFLPHGILLVITLAVLVRQRRYHTKFPSDPKLSMIPPLFILIPWLFFMSLPATLTREGLPHALRSIGIIPPIMISSGFGAWWLYQKAMEWIRQKQATSPERTGQLERVKREIAVLSILILIFIPVYTYRNYFVRWAYNPDTYFAFSTDLLHLGQYLDKLPPDTQKYIVVNLPGVEVRGIPMPAQTVMFATDTFGEEKRREKNIRYLLPTQIAEVGPPEIDPTSQRIVIAFLNGEDRALVAAIQKKFPDFKIRVPSDFVILQNY